MAVVQENTLIYMEPIIILRTPQQSTLVRAWVAGDG